MKIEKINLKKIPEILKLSKEFELEYLKKYNIKNSPPIEKLTKEKEIIFKTNLKNKKGLLLSAKENKNYIGYIFAFKGFPLHNPVKSKAYISDLFVKKEFRKKGIAKKLITECTKWCKKEKTNEIFLDVNVKNLNAKNLYKKMEFKEQKMRLSKLI